MSVSNSRKIFLIFSAIMLVLGHDSVFAQVGKRKSPSGSLAHEIRFANGRWKDMAAEAKRRGKYIFVDAYTSWCAPCRQLKNVTFKEKNAVAYFNSNFINYTIDMEKGEGIDLAGKWDVTAYRALLFFSPEGKMVMKQVGYVDGKKLIELGKQALARK